MNLDKDKIRLSLEENSGDLQGVISDLLETFVKENLEPVDTEELLRDVIDEEGPVQIAGLSFTRSRIIEELDPVAWNCMVSDFSDSYTEIDGDYYEESEVSEIESEIESIVWDIQNEETEEETEE